MRQITTIEAGNRLGISPRRVLALIKAGRIPARKLGRDWMLDEVDLERVRVRKPGRPRKES